ncbi:hypothetical protein BH23BAC1_BH23BAC1_25530 [soil metagenome]
MNQINRIPSETLKYIEFEDKNKISIDVSNYLSKQLEDSFNEKPKIVKLRSGFNLWRFCSSANRYYFSDCWIDDPTMSEIMTSFRAVGIYDKKFKKDLIRNQLAILYNWNKIDFRVKIELKVDMIAYIGTISSQKVFIPVKSDMIASKGAKVEKLVEHRIGHRIGGHIQYVIPKLKKMPFNKKENQFAKVLHFGPI